MSVPQAMTWLAVSAVVAALGWLAWRWNTRPILVSVAAPVPADFPHTGFAHGTFERLLKQFADASGRIDYEAWVSDPDAVGRLDSYLATVGRFSPDATPDRFEDDSERSIYWMHAYNAFVIKAVLLNWPLKSVRDIRAPVELIKGLGFFYRLRFVAGGKRYSLYAIEHDKVLKSGGDPRAHFILNCGSAGCPAIRPELPAGSGLENTLAQAATDFVSNPQNVRIDHDARRIHLSAIFKWYERDFVTDLRRRGLPAAAGAIDYVRSIAPAGLTDELERASDYGVDFTDYDWTVNASGASP